MQGIGASLSGLAAGEIVDHFGYSSTFLILGGAALVALIVFAIQMPETVERRQGRQLLGGIPLPAIVVVEQVDESVRRVGFEDRAAQQTALDPAHALIDEEQARPHAVQIGERRVIRVAKLDPIARSARAGFFSGIELEAKLRIAAVHVRAVDADHERRQGARPRTAQARAIKGIDPSLAIGRFERIRSRSAPRRSSLRDMA
jgi:hypothetical protein